MLLWLTRGQRKISGEGIDVKCSLKQMFWVGVTGIFGASLGLKIKSNQIYFSVPGNNNTQYKSIDLN